MLFYVFAGYLYCDIGPSIAKLSHNKVLGLSIMKKIAPEYCGCRMHCLHPLAECCGSFAYGALLSRDGKCALLASDSISEAEGAAIVPYRIPPFLVMRESLWFNFSV